MVECDSLALFPFSILYCKSAILLYNAHLFWQGSGEISGKFPVDHVCSNFNFYKSKKSAQWNHIYDIPSIIYETTINMSNLPDRRTPWPSSIPHEHGISSAFAYVMFRLLNLLALQVGSSFNAVCSSLLVIINLGQSTSCSWLTGSEALGWKQLQDRFISSIGLENLHHLSQWSSCKLMDGVSDIAVVLSTFTAALLIALPCGSTSVWPLDGCIPLVYLL